MRHIPIHLHQPRLVIVERVQVGAVRRVNRQPAATGDIADDPVAGHRAAALGQMHHQVVDALDLDALFFDRGALGGRLVLRRLRGRAGGGGRRPLLVDGAETVGDVNGRHAAVPDGREQFVRARQARLLGGVLDAGRLEQRPQGGVVAAELPLQQPLPDLQTPLGLLHAKPVLDLVLGPRRLDELQPVTMRHLAGSRRDLDRVAASELILERHHFAVDLGPVAVVADLGVNGVRKVDRRRALDQLLDRALGREDVDDVRIEVKLHRLHELPVVGEVLVRLEQLAQPLEGALLRIIDLALLLVRPVRRNAFLGDPVHLLRPDLKLHVLALRPGDGGVQRLVVIGLGDADVVLEAARHRPPEGMNEPHDGVAIHRGVGDDPDGGDIVDLVERHALPLHLLGDGVQMFGAADKLAGEPVLRQLGQHDRDDLLDVLLPLLDPLLHPFGQRRVDVGLEGLEAEVLQLRLHPADAEAVCQRRVDLDRLLGDLLLVRRGQVLQGTHVVQAVRELDQDDPDVVGHRDQHLAEVLGLLFLVALEMDLADFRDAVHQSGHVLAECRLDLLLRADRVLDRIVQEAGHDGRHVQLQGRQDLGHRQWML